MTSPTTTTDSRLVQTMLPKHAMADSDDQSRLSVVVVGEVMAVRQSTGARISAARGTPYGGDQDMLNIVDLVV